jgi:spore coat polysaccharide biosynthesis predicted glycosyltransferase SpsG
MPQRLGLSPSAGLRQTILDLLLCCRRPGPVPADRAVDPHFLEQEQSMNRDPIFIRVDATPHTGYERLARCMTLAGAIQRRRRPVYFLSQLEPNALAMGIKRAGHDWINVTGRAGTPQDIAEVQQEVRRLHPAAVVVDDADVDEAYFKALSGSGAMLVAVDHAAAVRFPVRLLVNPLLGPSREGYEIARGTQVLLGRNYALVRPDVRRHRPTRAQEPPALVATNGKPGSASYRVLLALGEDDPHRRVKELARLLVNTPRVGKVDIIVRREHPDLEALQTLAAASSERIELALEPAEIAARLVRCHFAVTSGSGWSLDLACLGVPQLLLLQQEAHWPNAQRLEEEGCASVLGWHENVSAATIRLAVQNLLNDPLERQAMSRCGRKLIDGRGPDRLVNALEILLSPARRSQAVRQAA